MKHSSHCSLFGELIHSYLPNYKDNINQIIIKLVFVTTIFAMIFSFISVSCHFLKIKSETDILENNYIITKNDTFLTNHQMYEFKSRNPDFKGYLKIGDTNIKNPVYQSKNNNYYLTHNQLKKESVFGALFFDCENNISSESLDKNFIIYGNKTENGQLFSELENYKKISFFSQNSNINLSTLYSNTTYAIYSVFIINSKPEDDGGYIYNYKQKHFSDALEFENWIAEAKHRSIIDTNISASYGDNILTLVTDSEEFSGAKLVIMAKSVKENENINTINSVIAKNPRYPKIYYTQKGIDFPF